MNKEQKIKEFEEKLKSQIKETKEFEEQVTDDIQPVDIIDSIFSQEREHDKDKIIEILFEHPDLRKIADISHDDLINITVLFTFAEHVKTPLITQFCEHYLALSLSKDRKSREEIVEIYKTQIYGDMGEGGFSEAQPSRFQRFRDRLSF